MSNNMILLVDDEPAYHAIVEALLAKAGIPFHGVRDAPAAFQAVREHHYDLILMDIRMAGISGFRGAAHIRSASEWTRNVPIIAFTALDPPDGVSHFIARGFSGWLKKPFDAEAFEAMLSRWLSPAPHGRASKVG